MCKENEIDRAHKIEKTAGRTRYSKRPRPQRGEHIFDRMPSWDMDARVVMAERMQLMCVGGGDQWFAEVPRYFFCAPVRIKETPVKMAELDCVEAIHFVEQTSSD
jgi:hypothetical protein